MTTTKKEVEAQGYFEHSQVSPDALLQLGFGFWGSKTLLSAIEIGPFAELADGALSGETLVAPLKLHRRSARDFLDELVALGMFGRHNDRYVNTPAADVFLDRPKPSYLGSLLEMASGRLYPLWGGLTEALRTGEPQNEAKQGRDLFDELYNDPRRLAEFLKEGTGLSRGSAIAIVEKFPWQDHKTFTDIGTAQSGLAAELARAHPHVIGIGFDLPVVWPYFELFVAQLGLDGRLSFRAGDFFADALPSADVVILGHILHDWGKRHLIGKAYDPLPYGGALMVYDTIIDDERRECIRFTDEP